MLQNVLTCHKSDNPVSQKYTMNNSLTFDVGSLSSVMLQILTLSNANLPEAPHKPNKSKHPSNPNCPRFAGKNTCSQSCPVRRHYRCLSPHHTTKTAFPEPSSPMYRRHINPDLINRNRLNKSTALGLPSVLVVKHLDPHGPKYVSS